LPVQYLKGVGEKIAKLLEKSDIRSLWDLLLTLPRTYEDRRHFHTIEEIIKLAPSGEAILSRAIVDAYTPRMAGPRGRRWLEARGRLIGEGQDAYPITFTWFQDFGGSIQTRFPPGTTVVFRAKAQDFRGRLQFVHPEFQKTEGELPWWEFGGYVPVYREIAGISTRVFRRVLAQALTRPECQDIPEVLPADLRKRLAMPSLRDSLRELHFPKKWEPRPEDLRPEGPYLSRVVFEELFMMALALHLRRAEWRKKGERSASRIPKMPVAAAKFEAWKSKLPFPLTGDQKTVLGEIFQDISLRDGALPMHRLVQGDVGSGKTIVAFLSVLAAMENGFQAALMAPTEILADQHFASFSRLFPEHAHEVLLLKGALTAKAKKETRHALETGQVRFIIGTQALLTDSTLFEKLGLVIIDEQHRFGVEQRLGLKDQSDSLMPHLLVMTATPIPRSLALTLYGDLSISLIKEKPVGRIPIRTHVVKRKQHAALVKRLQQFTDEGRQVYIVYPLVEESEELDLKDVQTAYAEWTAQFPKLAIGLLHGRMKSQDKDAVMRAFKAGDIRVLVSTTVIEVGVDVPNASVIVIEHAERFGLSQLHQLRGRVGRGSLESLCVLVGPDYQSPLAEERLRILESSDDGFYIAEKDLELRGPGEFLGRRQSGMPGFRVANIIRDLQDMVVAREEARKILDADPTLERPEHQQLRFYMERWWAGRMELTLSG
jgi:ATP-dependent DNA helicase RecG